MNILSARRWSGILLRMVVVCLLLLPGKMFATEYVALIVGNDKYDARGAFPRLSNCVRDAKLIEDILKGMGFKVISTYNASRSAMDAARVRFEDTITSDTVALFYFAGHGIEFEGKNYLMGTNARLAGHSTLGEDAMEADTFAATMLEKQAVTSFVILDCCREAPPVGWQTRGFKKRGLAEVKTDGDIIIAYSAKPGQAALDGQGKHSPYATALAQWLPQGLSSADMFQSIREAVLETTGRQQRTWESGSLSKRFTFPRGKGFQAAAVSSTSTVASAPRREDTSTPPATTDRTSLVSNKSPLDREGRPVTPERAIARPASVNDTSPDVGSSRPSTSEPSREYVILTGGPTLTSEGLIVAQWEDKFWGSYVRAARTRFQQLQQENGNDPNAIYTWLVYANAYKSRGEVDRQDYIANIHSVRDKYHLRLFTVTSGSQVIDYLNTGFARDRVKVVDFEYFGHAGALGFMLDFSNAVHGASKVILPGEQFKDLRRNVFARNAFVKSWGSHTGETMSKKFYSATGMRMIGAIGEVDYSNDKEEDGLVPLLSSADGRWVQ